ncbi:unnamed protein product [Meganyctiphanes norvegica]|uniref:Endophilin-A n=1 Tax=Meganyctiphanes norvegica TaxID=48144 RepID=A0AAV2SJ88_MEGNR
MAFTGLVKQINKANQFMNEKIGSAQGTKFNKEFVEMERKVDIYDELTKEMVEKTKEFLRPNPDSRTKRSCAKGIYSQPSEVLGDCMVEYGNQFGEHSIYAKALVETGESMQQISDIKDNLDENMKMCFLDPIHLLSEIDIKEVMHHRKKLQGRRLDFDCKKRKMDNSGSNVTEEEIKLAEDKFAESWHLAQVGMHNILENDVEQVSQLVIFAENLLEYHKQCGEILEELVGKLNNRKNEAAIKPKKDFVPKALSDLGIISTLNVQSPSSRSPSPLPSPMNTPASTRSMAQPSATAIYDYEPDKEDELGFLEGDTIILTQQINENWFEGSLNGKTGLFPCTYVQVTLPLPN